MFEAGQLPADVLPTPKPQHAAVAPKRDRRHTLTKIDRRGRLGKRVAELTAMFAAAVGGEQTPMRKLKIDKAAQLTALAELAQGDYARDGKGVLKDVLLAERRAAAAVKALDLDETRARPKPALSLLAQMAEGAR
jgi:hypothetical protein